MTTTPPAKGGMPKWLIILLVIFLFIVLGCCGGLYMCHLAVKKAGEAIRENAPVIEQRMREEAEKQIQEAQRRAEEEAKRRGTTVPTIGGDGAPAPVPMPTPSPADGGAGGGATPAPAGDATPTPEPAPQATRMPPNFPTDVPIYKGMVPTFAIGDQVKGSGSVLLSGSEDPQKVIDYYTKQMTDKGWKQESNMSINGGAIMVYSKDAMQTSVSVTPDGQKTMVQISYEKK